VTDPAPAPGHQADVEAGYRDNGPPGVREQYSSEEGGRYYAAFLLDPDRRLTGVN